MVVDERRIFIRSSKPGLAGVHDVAEKVRANERAQTCRRSPKQRLKAASSANEAASEAVPILLHEPAARSEPPKGELSERPLRRLYLWNARCSASCISAMFSHGVPPCTPPCTPMRRVHLRARIARATADDGAESTLAQIRQRTKRPACVRTGQATARPETHTRSASRRLQAAMTVGQRTSAGTSRRGPSSRKT